MPTECVTDRPCCTQVDTAPFPHVVIQLSQPGGVLGPLAPDLTGKAAALAPQDVNTALASAAAWVSLAGSSLPYPHAHHLVCFVGTDAGVAHRAACAAAAIGYHRYMGFTTVGGAVTGSFVVGGKHVVRCEHAVACACGRWDGLFVYA